MHSWSESPADVMKLSDIRREVRNIASQHFCGNNIPGPTAQNLVRILECLPHGKAIEYFVNI